MDETLNQLLNEVQTISESYEKIAEATGENFNIFSVLKVETNEVSTHSRFISELLNPKGVHGQENKFLKAFVEIVEEIVEEIEYIKINTDTTKVYTEFPSKNGRVDILLKDAESQSIVIENKVYSDESENQLDHYASDFPHSLKLYLTLYGEEPSNGEFKSISYENDILKWLERCKELAVDAPILRESIAQYINLLKKLTNQNLYRKMSEKITERVLKDRNSFNAFKTLMNAKREVIYNSLKYHFLPRLKQIADKYELTLKINDDDFLNQDEKWRGFRMFNEKLLSNNLNIFFEFEKSNYNGLTFGFSYNNIEEKENYSYQKIAGNFQKEFGKYLTEHPTPCFQVYTEYENWSDLNTLEQVIFGNFFDDFENKLTRLIGLI